MQKSNESLGVWSIHLSNNPSICVCNTWIIIRDMNRVGHPKKKKKILTVVGINVTLQSITQLLRQIHAHMVPDTNVLFHHIASKHTQFEYYHIKYCDSKLLELLMLEIYFLFLHQFQSYCNKLFIYSTWLSTVLSQTLQINETFKQGNIAFIIHRWIAFDYE